MSAKKMVLSFLLFTNIIMLAHSVVHHQYSDSPMIVCSADSLFNDCENTHEHHDTKGTKKCCNIGNCPLTILYTYADPFKLTLPKYHPIDFFINNISIFQPNHINEWESLPSWQKPYIFPHSLDVFSQSMGLRAPPVF